MRNNEDQHIERIILRVPVAGDLVNLINERLTVSREQVRSTEAEIRHLEAHLEGVRRAAVKGREEVRYWESQLDLVRSHEPRYENTISISGPVSSHDVTAVVQNGIDARLRAESAQERED